MYNDWYLSVNGFKKAMRSRRSLLLINQIPPKPDYLRVKIWRRVQHLGAVPVKNSVDVCPRAIKPRRIFEVVESGGGLSLCEGRSVDGLSDAGERG
jgi:hypothetical protein